MDDHAAGFRMAVQGPFFPDIAAPRAPVLSPDGRRVALTRLGDVGGGGSDIWLLDAKGLLTRFTSGERGGYAVWSADGE
ncbi:MAG TPA: hypothetical protein VEZ14_14880, partial [Dehalococcoidia bacterium]|nr:hypothetical protein [Dehalococcoidia bacterium]